MKKYSLSEFVFVCAAALLMLSGCAQQTGLVLKGTVVVPALLTDKSLAERVWLGIWGGADKREDFSGVPLAAVTLADIQASSGSDVGGFKWQTGIFPEGGSHFWVAAFIEPIHGANGIPDEGTELYKAAENPVKFETGEFVASGNGQWDYKDSLTIQAAELLYEEDGAIKDTVDAMTELMKSEQATALAFMDFVHPFYSDVFLNSYNSMEAWFGGTITSGLDLEEGPLFGIMGRSRLDMDTEHAQFTDGAELKPSGSSADLSFLYHRKFDLVEVETSGTMTFRQDGGAAKLLEWRPVRTRVGEFMIETAQTKVDENTLLIFEWSDYGSGITYAISLDRWRPKLKKWEKMLPEIPPYDPANYAGSLKFRTSVSTCPVSVGCTVLQFDDSRLYRITVEPLQASDGKRKDNTYSHYYLPGSQLVNW